MPFDRRRSPGGSFQARTAAPRGSMRSRRWSGPRGLEPCANLRAVGEQSARNDEAHEKYTGHHCQRHVEAYELWTRGRLRTQIFPTPHPPARPPDDETHDEQSYAQQTHDLDEELARLADEQTDVQLVQGVLDTQTRRCLGELFLAADRNITYRAVPIVDRVEDSRR